MASITVFNPLLEDGFQYIDSGILAGAQNVFTSVQVNGQSDIIADSLTTPLLLEEGANITITTDPSTYKVTISAAGGTSPDLLYSVALSGGATITADSPTTNITFIPGNNISFTGNATNKTILFDVDIPDVPAFYSVAVSGQSNVTATIPMDTITLKQGENISLTTSTLDNSITITAIASYIAPEFISFTIDQPSSFEVGYTFSGLSDFYWTTTNSPNIDLNSLFIKDGISNTVISSGIPDFPTPDTGAWTSNVGLITYSTPSTHTWSINGVDVKSRVFSREASINWRYKVYYGTHLSSVIIEANVLALNSLVPEQLDNTYIYGSSGYKYFCHESSLGTITLFNDDDTGLTIPFEIPYTIPITNGYGVTANYKIYRSTNIINSAININVRL